MSKPKILITNPLSPVVTSLLRKKSRLDVQFDLSEIELVERIRNYDAIICRSATRIRSCVLGEGKKGNLKIIGTATAGFDHINIDTANRLRLPVVYSPFGNTLANAEYIMGAILAASRNFLKADKLLREGIWDQEIVLGRELNGKTFGTIGFGKIGSLVAERAKSFGMKVLASDPSRPKYEFTAKGVERATLGRLLRESDFISLSVPLNASNVGFIGRRELALVKRTAYVVQSSRGGIIDEEALLYFLKKKRIAGAVIDVFENEPDFNPQFRELDNVILTPHIACSAQESRIRSGSAVARDVINYLLRGQRPINLVPQIG